MGSVDGLKVQGVLYLTDTPANQGAFTCIPGFHHKLGDWLNDLPEDADPRRLIKQRNADAVRLRGKRGIWLSGTVPCHTAAAEQRRSSSDRTVYHHVACSEGQ